MAVEPQPRDIRRTMSVAADSPSPRPPNSTGTVTPRKPASARASMFSRGNVPVRSTSTALRATVSVMILSSSSGSNKTALQGPSAPRNELPDLPDLPGDHPRGPPRGNRNRGPQKGGDPFGSPPSRNY